MKDIKYIIIVKIIYFSEFQVRTFFKCLSEILILFKRKELKYSLRLSTINSFFVLSNNWISILPATDAVDNSTVVLWSACFLDTDECYRNSRLLRPHARCRRIYFPFYRSRDIGRPYLVLPHLPRRRMCHPNQATSYCIFLLVAPVIIMQIRTTISHSYYTISFQVDIAILKEKISLSWKS